MKEELNNVSKEILPLDTYESGDECIYEYPIIQMEDRHGFLITAVVMSIANGKMTCKGMYDDYGDDYEYNVEYLNADEVMNLYRVLF
jgi:hypothetical protein